MLSENEILFAKSLEVYCDDPIPGYFEFLNKTWISFQEFGLNFTRYPVDYDFAMEMIRAIKITDLSVILFLTIMFAFLRIIVTRMILIPYAKWLQVNKSDLTKFYESSWKCLIYASFWSLERHIVSSGRYTLFDYPLRVWKGMEFTSDILKTEIPNEIYCLYMVQLAFYLYSIYAVFRLDAWRTDSIMLMMHHVLTIFLLEFSFIMRYHLVGALVLYLHDIADVLLEFTKSNVYLKARSCGLVKLNRFLSDVGYVAFVLVWFVFRLYWYPLKVLHMTNWGAYITQIGKDPKMYLILNVMLFMLLFMNIYWFSICLRLGYRIMTGQLKEVEDVRETEVDLQKSSKPVEPSEDDHRSAFKQNGTDVSSSLDQQQHHHANGQTTAVRRPKQTA